MESDLFDPFACANTLLLPEREEQEVFEGIFLTHIKWGSSGEKRFSFDPTTKKTEGTPAKGRQRQGKGRRWVEGGIDTLTR